MKNPLVLSATIAAVVGVGAVVALARKGPMSRPRSRSASTATQRAETRLLRRGGEGTEKITTDKGDKIACREGRSETRRALETVVV
jgi:hypothetical protein